MFEIGKTYEIRMIVGGEETTMWKTVEKYEHPLVKFADVPPSELVSHTIKGDLVSHTIKGDIVNISSPYFISAVEQQDG